LISPDARAIRRLVKAALRTKTFDGKPLVVTGLSRKQL
jgi:hypothetical protein